MSEPSGRASRIYRAVALQVFNSIVGLVLLNLLLALGYGVLDRARPPRPGALRLPSAALDRAYPEMSPAARDSMLAEIWSRPLELEPYALLREPAFRGRFVNVSPAGFRLVPDPGP